LLVSGSVPVAARLELWDRDDEPVEPRMRRNKQTTKNKTAIPPADHQKTHSFEGRRHNPLVAKISSMLNQLMLARFRW